MDLSVEWLVLRAPEMGMTPAQEPAEPDIALEETMLAAAIRLISVVHADDVLFDVEGERLQTRWTKRSPSDNRG